MRVRALGADAGAKGIVAGKTAVTIEFESANFLSRQSRAALSHRFGNRLEFAWQDKPSLTFTLGPESDDDPLDIAAELCTAIAEL